MRSARSSPRMCSRCTARRPCCTRRSPPSTSTSASAGPPQPARCRPSWSRSRRRPMPRDLKNGRIVIVGASLAGLRAAETLREEGFAGELTMVGEERELPYDRPPLSKQVLLGRVRAEDTGLPRRRKVDAKWKLGLRAIGVDPIGKRVLLADGEELPFDRLLIATGTRARPWPNADEAALDGVFTLRTCEDAARLAERLNAGPRRVLVIGAGFTGSEIASACRERGIDVTVAERGPAPLVGALGGAFGTLAAKLQRAHGVDLRCGVTVTALTGRDGKLTGAELSDGARIEADIAVIALGAIRNTEWLAQSGLAAGPRGVACDAGCRAFNMYGIVTDDVFVAGDVARFRIPCSSTRCSPSNTGATRSRRPRWRPTTWSTRDRCGGPTWRCPPSGQVSSASISSPSACPPSPTTWS